jgi:hypothetical protein
MVYSYWNGIVHTLEVSKASKNWLRSSTLRRCAGSMPHRHQEIHPGKRCKLSFIYHRTSAINIVPIIAVPALRIRLLARSVTYLVETSPIEVVCHVPDSFQIINGKHFRSGGLMDLEKLPR